MVWLPARSDFAIAVAAVDRFVASRLERYFGALAAFGAHCWEHLTPGPVAVVSVPFCFSCLTAFRAAFGLVSIAFGSKELLVLGTEGKSGSALDALERLVLITHWMTSSLINSVRVRVIQRLIDSVRMFKKLV
jgi:hypothetical protein